MSQRLTAGIYLRMSPADLKRWHKAAADLGVSLADLIRQSVEWRLSPEGESDARAQVAAMARRVG